MIIDTQIGKHWTTVITLYECIELKLGYFILLDASL